MSECRIWVNRVILTMRRSLPVYPDKQTFLEPVGMSQKCHNRTHAPHKALAIQSPHQPQLRRFSILLAAHDAGL
jgi:hypothetical protein